MPKTKEEFAKMMTEEEAEKVRKKFEEVRKLRESAVITDILGENAMTTSEIQTALREGQCFVVSKTPHAVLHFLKRLLDREVLVRRYGTSRYGYPEAYWMLKDVFVSEKQ